MMGTARKCIYAITCHVGVKSLSPNFEYKVCIEYWNLYLRKLQSEFMWSEGNVTDEGTEHLLLYYNYLFNDF